jgi:LPS O-antigen subunit length determinant protein (WzzB/FepE family)
MNKTAWHQQPMLRVMVVFALIIGLLYAFFSFPAWVLS